MSASPFKKAVSSPLPEDRGAERVQRQKANLSLASPSILRRDLYRKRRWWPVIIAIAAVLAAISWQLHQRGNQSWLQQEQGGGKDFQRQLAALLYRSTEPGSLKDVEQLVHKQIKDYQISLAEERRKNQVLERAAISTHSTSERLETCNQELQQATALRDSLQAQLTEKQRLIEAYEGRDEACYASLHNTKHLVRHWQKTSLAVGSICLALFTALFSIYKRRIHKKVWLLTSERAQLSAALKMAQTGLQQRMRQPQARKL